MSRTRRIVCHHCLLPIRGPVHRYRRRPLCYDCYCFERHGFWPLNRTAADHADEYQSTVDVVAHHQQQYHGECTDDV